MIKEAFKKIIAIIQNKEKKKLNQSMMLMFHFGIALMDS